MEPYLMDDEHFLLLSGIQHMAFCERQWALIHMEQAWEENVLTLEGRFLHEKTDDPFTDETRGDVRTVRAMPLLSRRLGLRGVADVVEFYKSPEHVEGKTVVLPGRKGWWLPVPVEYKRGKPKKDDRDEVQLAAQAIALEEMFGVAIEKGYLFYAEIRRRVEVLIDPALRSRVEDLSEKMNLLMREEKTPKAVKGKHCSLCSLMEICQPNLTSRNRPVGEYIKRMLETE